MKESLIVFKLEYLRTVGWGAISNFITKFSENLPMELSDVEIVSSTALKAGKPNFYLIKELNNENTIFKEIRRPEKIYDVKEKYDYVFFVSVDYEQLNDVVDLQYLYLICDACKQCRIVTLISGQQSEYHKVSHFFTFLTQNKGIMYEKVFFKCDGIRHLQLKGIGALTKFLPLVPIDADEDIRMRRRVEEFVSIENMEEALAGKEADNDIPKILTGALRKISQYKRKFSKCEVGQCTVLLGGLNILSFILFCFSLEGKEDDFDNVGILSEELQKITHWSNGCLQLIENITFHSDNKRGEFTFRILDGGSAYIREKYSLKEKHAKWIEMMIVDYAGHSHTMNIAERFRENLKNSDTKMAFADLKPRDFFAEDENESIAHAWKCFYSEMNNVVNHYGIKIFHKAVQNNNGHFIAQSYSTHQLREGEFYCDAEGINENLSQICLPGTSYSILIPIGQKNVKEEYEDFGIEYFENKIDARDILFNYRRIDREIAVRKKMVSPQEKLNYINQIAGDLLKEQGETNDNQVEKRDCIVSVNAAKLHGDIAEIVYKAIILAMLQSNHKCHIVLCECQQEFVQGFLDASYLGSANLKEELNDKLCGQIVLYTAVHYEEIIVIPQDWESTCYINHMNNFSRETRWKVYFEKWTFDRIGNNSGEKFRRYPFDVFAGEHQNDSVFERYVETVVKRNIQEPVLGCKIENTHMRLGSTIHVNHFYEAEILFGNSLFVERFALLMIKRMLNPLESDMLPLNASDRVTLYGYTNYSEQTVFCTMHFLEQVLPGIDVDYAILERESEDRGFTHVDRIRYSTCFQSGEIDLEERERYFQSRKIVCVIPIASTLKTNEKMINIFLEENGKQCRGSFWKNFELILVGSNRENRYWKKDGKQIIGREGMEIWPIPEFFVEVTLDYMEPLECTMCFPEQIIDEQPLIEVNAASTIPNQAFGLISEKKEACRINKKELRKEEQRLEVLKDLLLYRHLERKNHFVFYFQTENLIVRHSDEVCKWLSEIKKGIEIEPKDYVVLFCPAHFSNAAFIEYVNSYVFGSAAVIIRDDVDKEYRCNFKTKFSNLRNFVEKIKGYENGDCKRRIRLFYVDDAIITGQTFYRARSLAQSIMEDSSLEERQKYAVFEGIFVLIDRNSTSSKWQYTGVNEEERLYAFRTVHISSIRNHGDACVYCNLAKEAETLKKSSVTKEMETYWRSEEEKFSVIPLGAYLRERKKNAENDRGKSKWKEKNARAFRRLVCTNNAMIFLNEKYHGNCKEEVLTQLLMLILEGSSMHEGEEAEFFLSYCKVLSRPFRVFDKEVREAVFDFLLLTGICTLSGESYDSVIASSEKKPYLQKKEIKQKFLEIETFLQRFFSDPIQRQALLKVLFKQLTEMKSNFIMRKRTMEQVFDYVDQLDTENGKSFIRYYKYLIKKLTGVSSDTSKSLWLDRMLCKNWEGNDCEVCLDIYLENVWIYQDAFQKLNGRVKIGHELWENLLNHFNEGEFEEKLAKFGEEEIAEYLKPYQFKDFISLIQSYGMCDGGQRLNKEGEIFVAANFLLYHFITGDFESGLRRVGVIDKGNLTKVDFIATCMKYILKARDVSIVMEFDAEYELWENILVNRFNELLPPNMKQEELIWETKKEYIILGSSDEKNGKWTIKEKELVKKAREFQKEKSWAERGYAIDAKEAFFCWELGCATEYPVYVFAKWEDSEECNKVTLERLNRIRSVMQYYWQLNNSVFNRSNEGFFYEIAQQRKKNAIHDRQKAYTHTKSDIKLIQYDHMLHQSKYREYYQSDLLMLLADLNVSEHYRNSLTLGYYLKGDSLLTKPWNFTISPFGNCQEFDVISSEADITTKLKISREVLVEGDLPLREDERVWAFSNANGVKDSYLLIYSLMLNAVSRNRGKVEHGCVTVYCSCTPDGKLRIINQIGEKPLEKEPKQIEEELCDPPEEENQGISLWSMSRYIKAVIASIIDNSLKSLEKETPVREEEMTRMRQRILRFLGDEFKISIERLKICGKEYFSISVPILAIKYEEK